VDDIAELVTRARTAESRDERIEAFGHIVRRFQDMACGYAYSILGDFHLAEDAAQEAFIAAFRQLSDLRQPAAFPGWFRRILWSACGRFAHRSQVATAPLEAAAERPSREDQPAEAMEKAEMRDAVIRAINDLPPPEREATTLFYINGYSQQEVADFLEVPVTTVKNRLSASRGRLKERMLHMVKDTLHGNAPDACFGRKIIDELLSRPRPLEVPGHPVSQVWNAIREVLADYTVIVGDEVVARAIQVAVSGAADFVIPESDKALRTNTTITTLSAMAGRKPPVRLLTAGRVFRGSDPRRQEDALHLRVFHTADALCIDKDADRAGMQGVLTGLFQMLLGVRAEQIGWQEGSYPSFEDGLEVSVEVGGKWVEVGGSGMLPAAILRQAGFDPQELSGFAFGLGLERIAMLRLGLDDIRKLWQPPYVP
jgi:RNA polymerase sigma factor (sigma-70 family)